MSYDSNPDTYINPDTGILKNLLGLTTQQDLDSAEADITAAIIASIPDYPPLGEFDLEHLKNIHWELFNALYDWAGEIRLVEIAKENTRFANSEIIVQAANALFSQLKSDNLLKNLARDEFIDKLAHYYSEVNVLHPFREGNGRTERVFFGQLVASNGYRLAWERLDPEENLRACKAAYNGDESSLAQMLDSLLEKI